MLHRSAADLLLMVGGPSRPTMVERASALREGGYRIDIRGAALDVVSRAGALDPVRAQRTDVQGGSIVNAAGKRVATLDGDTFGGRAGHDAEILRGELNRIHYDLTLDGADGLHSNTRALVFGPEERFIRDLGYYVSIYSVPNHLDLDRWELTYVSPLRTALTYSTAKDTGAKAMILFASGPLEYDRHDVSQQKKLLAEAYAGEAWEVPRLLAVLDEAPDFYFDSLSQAHLDHWSKGRTTLVGDSAYCASPASGQGTSLALAGAYVLAGELAAAGGDHVTGFAGYEREMRRFAEENQNLGPSNIKHMVMRTKRQISVQLTMLSLLGRLPGKQRMMAKVMEPIQKAANSITLKDY